MRPTMSTSRPVHNYSSPQQDDCSAQQVESIWRDFIHSPSPQQRNNNKYSTVRGTDAPEICRLQGGDYAVKYQHQRADKREPNALAFADAKPDQIAATDFTEGRQDEE